MASTRRPMWCQTSWIVRFCAWRIQCLILAKVCSIGLRSGEWREIPEPSASVADGAPDGRGFVAAQIVHDDDVAWAQDRGELLLDISAKAFAIDRTVEDAGRGETVAAQCAQERQRAPMAVRSEAAQAFSLWAPAAQRRHVGLDPGFVDEDEALRIDAALPGAPSPTPAGDVFTSLLKREQSFF